MSKPLKKKPTNVLKPNWLAKCFVIREKKNYNEELKKNGNMKKFKIPKGQMVIRGQCDLAYDIKGRSVHLLSVWPSL